jgi:nicotinamidase/pyrazinamidase
MHITVNRQTTAAFDIDAQNTFTPLCPNELPVPEGHLIVEELNRQATYARIRLASKDAHSPMAEWVATPKHPVGTPIDAPNMDVRWPVHAVPGTKGFELIDGLPAETQYRYVALKGVEPNKHPYGACYQDLGDTESTGVIEVLCAEAIETVICGGLATDYCVKTTVLQLRKAGFNVIVNLGACRGIADSTVQAAIAEIQAAGAIVIDTANQLQDA